VTAERVVFTDWATFECGTGVGAGYDGRMAATPLDRTAVVDRYFMEHRAKLIDLAAYLDRVERAIPKAAKGSASDSDSAGIDFRHDAFVRAIAILTDGKPERARRVLEHFSDPSTEPIAKAPMKGATGAHPLGSARSTTKGGAS
jgi:hypothetical protein